ncbi:MAG: AAA family ATPase [Chloroflexota bacterium]|nr:MAG: AAA family ATPase [Chloroflexota bacterium]
MNESEQLEQAIAALEAQRVGLGDVLVDAAQAPLREKLAALNEEQSAAVATEPVTSDASGERRIVTVLFCDVTGSTSMAEKLDPEVWTNIMNEAFKQLTAAVERFDGTVARLMGDGILAIFGAPTAHEDDPERAVLSGLTMLNNIGPLRERLQREQELDFNIRVGINTGLVVVGAVGSEKFQEFTAMGDAVNLAARMEQAAKPGTVQISGDTYLRVAPLFDVEALGGVVVRGRSEPVQAFRVLGKKAVPGRVRGISGLDAPMIGRDAEMHTLRGDIIKLRQGEGKIVSIIGEAGLGKSRLVAELRAAPAPLAEVKSHLRWLQGRSLSYETATPYAPVARLLGDYFALDGAQSDEEKLEHIRANLAGFMAEQSPMATPYLAALLGISLTGEELERVRYLNPPQMRARTSAALLTFVEHLAARQPLVLILDDLHWADSASLDLLEQLVPLTERVGLMIVTLFRPDKEAPSWGYHEKAAEACGERYQTILLGPLAEEASRDLVANLISDEAVPETARALILDKAEGNPFFVEEIIRTLLDAGMLTWQDGDWQLAPEVDDFAVPDTLAGVITARLDRLDDKTRMVAQAAAVMGRQFEFGTLETIVGTTEGLEAALAELQRRELVSETSRTPYRMYQFKHALTQETAYDSLLLSNRRKLHLQVAEHLEEMGAAHSGDIAFRLSGEIARHYLGAEKQARALPYLVEAGDWAASAYATPEATSYYRQALALLEDVPEYQLETAQRAFEGLASIFTLSGDVSAALEIYEEMLELANSVDYSPMQVSALNKKAFIAATFHGQLGQAEALLAESERIARDYQDVAGLAELHTIQCGVCLSNGDFAGAVGHFDQSAELGQQLDLEEPLLFGISHTATTLMSMTRFEEGWQKAQEARKLAERLGNRKYLAEVLTQPYVDYHVSQGDLQAARDSAEEGLAIATPIGASIAEFQGHFQLAFLARWQGEYEEALAHLDHLERSSDTLPAPGFRLLPLAMLGGVYLDIGDQMVERSQAYHAEALDILGRGDGGFGSLAWNELAHWQLIAGDLKRAGEYLQNGLNARDSFMYFARPALLVGQALLALAHGQVPEAVARLAEARSFVEERGMQNYYALIALADGQVNSAARQGGKALEQFSQAESFARDMRMLPYAWQALAGAAKELSAAGRSADAEERRLQALDTIDEIAAGMVDEDLRVAFLRGARNKVGSTK